MNEIWKMIDGYEDYMISNLGRVKSLKFGKERILKIYRMNKYLKVGLCKFGIRKFKKIHIVLYETFNNYKLKDNECIHHEDKNKENNYIDNLIKINFIEHQKFHSTGKNNSFFGKHHSERTKKIMKDIKLKNNSRSKLTNEDVKYIKLLIKEKKLTQKEIAKKFNVRPQTISSINMRRTWNSIEVNIWK